MAAQKLVKLIKKGEVKRFHEAVREHEEKHGELPSLEMASFDGADLSGFDFTGIDLSNVAFENCTLAEVRFDQCPLDGVYMHGCTMFNCSFVASTGNGFALDTCTLSRCEFTDCTFVYPEWTDSQFNETGLKGISGSDFVMERVTFRGGRWESVQLASGELSHVTLRELEMVDVDLSKTDATACYLGSDVEQVGVELPDGGFTKKTGRRRVI